MKKRLLLVVTPVLLIFLLLLVWYSYIFRYSRNFYEVIPGQVYRSGQPSLDIFRQWHDKYQIKSILNLRGKHKYEKGAEAGVLSEYAAENNIHIDSLKLSSTKVLASKQLVKLIEIIESSSKPLLIHCRNGVDRSGIVSAIVKLLDNRSVISAKKEFSISYGYLPFRDTEVLKILFDDYAAWLRQQNKSSSKELFINWARSEYKPYYFSADIRALNPVSYKGFDQSKNIKVKITNTSNHVIHLTKSGKQGVYLAACAMKTAQLQKLTELNSQSSINSNKNVNYNNCWDILENYSQNASKNLNILTNSIDVFYKDYRLKPGQSADLDIILDRGIKPGHYTLELGLFDRLGISFNQYGNKNVISNFVVI